MMRDLQCAATQRGMEVVCAYARGEGGASDLKIGSAADVRLHGLMSRALDMQGRGSKRATRRFVEALERIQPDAVHLHNLHGYYLHYETLFAYLRARRVPVVWTLHDCWPLTGHCSHFVRANCEKWRTGCRDCPLKGAYPASWGLDRSRDNWPRKKRAFTGLENATIVTPSEWLAGIVSQSFLGEYPLRVIPNGVDLSVFTPGEAGSEHPRRKLLAVASPFDARKGYADALRVAQTLGEQAELTLVGLSEKQIAELPKGILGMRKTSAPEALIGLYREADCLLNPTYEDTYPTVNMEAIACGTPVAAYAVGGCPEQIAPGCGALVPVGDAKALANAAMAIQKDSQACRAHALAHFDRRAAMDAYLRLYAEIMHE